MKIDALFADLDGTFWGKGMQVHPATLDAVATLDKAGVRVVISTGRRAHSALAGLAAVGCADRPAILMNGGLVRDRIDGPSFLVQTIAPVAVTRIFELFAEADLEPLVYIDHPDADMLVGAAPAAGLDFVESAVGVHHTDELLTTALASAVIGFGAFGYPKGQLEHIEEAINKEGLATAVIGLSILEGDHGIMVQARGTDKATGIRAYCQRHDIDLNHIAAIGDGSNDIEMLELAALALVPSDAPDDIRVLADHEIAPNELGGWEAVPGLLGFSS